MNENTLLAGSETAGLKTHSRWVNQIDPDFAELRSARSLGAEKQDNTFAVKQKLAQTLGLTVVVGKEHTELERRLLRAKVGWFKAETVERHKACTLEKLTAITVETSKKLFATRESIDDIKDKWSMDFPIFIGLGIAPITLVGAATIIFKITVIPEFYTGLGSFILGITLAIFTTRRRGTFFQNKINLLNQVETSLRDKLKQNPLLEWRRTPLKTYDPNMQRVPLVHLAQASKVVAKYPELKDQLFVEHIEVVQQPITGKRDPLLFVGDRCIGVWMDERFHGADAFEPED